MTYDAIIISYVAEATLLIVASNLIKNPKLKIVKGFLFWFGVILAFLLGMYPMAISFSTTVSNFQPVSIALFVVNLFMALAFVFIYGVHLLKSSIEFIREAAKLKKRGR